MNYADVVKEIQNIHKSLVDLLSQKHKVYAKDDDPFVNFKLVAQFLGTDVEQVFLYMLAHKLARIRVYLSTRLESVESLEDTISDLINYSYLLLSYIKLRKGEKDGQKGV